jgi:hypothetical protein
MPTRLSSRVAIVVVGLVLAGCSVFQPNPVLPTVQAAGCRGVGLSNVTLAGDPKDSRVAWVVQNGKRRDVVFPNGYSARFSPDLEILDESGHVVARGCDAIGGGCVTGSDAQGPLLILWPPGFPDLGT